MNDFIRKVIKNDFNKCKAKLIEIGENMICPFCDGG